MAGFAYFLRNNREVRRYMVENLGVYPVLIPAKWQDGLLTSEENGLMKNHIDDKTIEKDAGDCALSELSGNPSLPDQMVELENIQGKADTEKKSPCRPLYLVHPLSTNKYPGKAATGKITYFLAVVDLTILLMLIACFYVQRVYK